MELAFVSDVFLLALLSHENCIHCQKWYQESFHWNDSRDTAVLAVSSTHLICSLMSFFYLFIYFFVIADIFFFKSIAWNLLSRIPYFVSVILFPFPDPRFRVLVLPRILFTFSAFWVTHCALRRKTKIPKCWKMPITFHYAGFKFLSLFLNCRL